MPKLILRKEKWFLFYPSQWQCYYTWTTYNFKTNLVLDCSEDFGLSGLGFPSFDPSWFACCLY
jgi:hypothetical protein